MTRAFFGVGACLFAGCLVLSQQAMAQETTTATGKPIVDVVVPELGEMAALGKQIFDEKCAGCHGANGGGNDQKGPPLIHKIYEPSHHGDMSFLIAVQNGARAHHWRFGSMEPVEGVTQEDVILIVDYVRTVQRANGID